MAVHTMHRIASSSIARKNLGAWISPRVFAAATIYGFLFSASSGFELRGYRLLTFLREADLFARCNFRRGRNREEEPVIAWAGWFLRPLGRIQTPILSPQQPATSNTAAIAMHRSAINSIAHKNLGVFS